MLTVENLRSGYGRLRVLNGVDLRIRPGELVCVIGANGAGKTTLLKSICGVLPLESGSVRLDGMPIQGMTPQAIVARGVALVAEGRRVFAPLTVDENLAMGAYLRHRKGEAAAIKHDLLQIYATFPILQSRSAQPAGLLSGGEQQMLAIARAMMSRPKLLLLDEPSMGLAPLIVRDIFDVLNRLRGQTTILLVEQNARIALQIASRGYVLERGAVVAEGGPEHLLQNDMIQQTYLGTNQIAAQ